MAAYAETFSQFPIWHLACLPCNTSHPLHCRLLGHLLQVAAADQLVAYGAQLNDPKVIAAARTYQPTGGPYASVNFGATPYTISPVMVAAWEPLPHTAAFNCAPAVGQPVPPQQVQVPPHVGAAPWKPLGTAAGPSSRPPPLGGATPQALLVHAAVRMPLAVVRPPAAMVHQAPAASAAAGAAAAGGEVSTSTMCADLTGVAAAPDHLLYALKAKQMGFDAALRMVVQDYKAHLVRLAPMLLAAKDHPGKESYARTPAP